MTRMPRWRLALRRRRPEATRATVTTEAAMTAIAGAGLMAFGELQALRASRADYPRHPAAGPAGGRDVVLVLGFRSREGGRHARPNALQASRTRIASNTAHARRARQYLRELDPALWTRLRPTRDFLPLELGPLRLALTFYDFVAGRVAARR